MPHRLADPGEPAVTSEKKYLVAFAGSRDGYQAAVALQEVGRLSRLVTDAYLPDRVAAVLPRLPGPARSRLSRRHADGLPSAVVRSMPGVVASRLVLQPASGQYRALRVTDDVLGRRAGRDARRLGLAGLVYSYYWEGFLRGGGRTPAPALVFQVHPVPSHIKRVLAADRARTGIHEWRDEEEVLASSSSMRFEDSLHHADGLVVPSAFVRAGLLDIGIPSEKIAVVPYGCAPGSRHDPAGEPGHHGALRLLWVGQASYRKGAHHLFAALRALPRGTATLTMVCRSGDLGMLEDLPPDVRVLGAVSSEHLHRLYASHDYFVMPSIAEGFGLVYLEAMSRGLPVVATPNTGIADIGAGSDALIVVPAGSADALRETIRILAEDRTDLPQRRRAACELASTMTWPRFRSDLRRALDDLAGT